jgi:hypothetical protein
LQKYESLNRILSTAINYAFFSFLQNKQIKRKGQKEKLFTFPLFWTAQSSYTLGFFLLVRVILKPPATAPYHTFYYFIIFIFLGVKHVRMDNPWKWYICFYKVLDLNKDRCFLSLLLFVRLLQLNHEEMILLWIKNK